MPKRFTETLKWDDKWFRALKPEFKLAWLYILDKCDGAGVIDIDHALADFQIGMSVDWEGFFKATETRLEPLAKGKHWVCKFIEFQYGSVSEDCKAHNPVILSLLKHGLSDRVSKGYPKGIQRDKVKVKVKDKEKDKEEDKEEGGSGEEEPVLSRVRYSDDFMRFWDVYPNGRKSKKRLAFKAWQVAVRETDPETIIQAASEYAQSPIGKSEYVCMPTSFLRGEMWEDDRASWVVHSGSGTNTKVNKATKF